LPAKHDRRTPLEGRRPPRRGHVEPAPEKVSDPKFRQSEFFDRGDAVQVKYEMLRRVSVENASVTEASDEYGSPDQPTIKPRPPSKGPGIAGLVPQEAWPARPHKLQGEVLAFLERHLIPGEPIRARELTKLIRHEFGLDVHPRTIERASH